MGTQATPDAEGGVWRVHAERGGAVQVLTRALGLLEGVHDIWALVKENQDLRLVFGSGARQRIHLKLSESTKIASGGMIRGALPCDDRRGCGAWLPRHPGPQPTASGPRPPTFRLFFPGPLLLNSLPLAPFFVVRSVGDTEGSGEAGG